MHTIVADRDGELRAVLEAPRALKTGESPMRLPADWTGMAREIAALVNTLPLTGAIAKRSLNLEGFTVPAGQTAPLFWLHVITPDYFRVMGIRLDRGRMFAPEDLSALVRYLGTLQ